ncbi:M1 family metallopeptidase [Catalinimonas niigatensis]|uniref:M1 family metallopeptidase n=1 Tax=Catalinimonas niigatensis TaxID=1397264 RepID=UPI002AA2A3DC|nr:M1 family metallopeptidase [Catalinimonas niigatensis]WPP48580.1 M1 family metallopeptidase [Catalinimonas niigatensis]
MMEVDMDVDSHQFEGKQKLVYSNNSSDTLFRVFYHLYFNAFQPGSMMDVRSRTIEDADRRVSDRIFYLNNDEIGFQRIQSLKQNGKELSYEMSGTILEVTLDKPILPNGKATFDMEFQGQVPLQVRRSGRDNAEGIAYSMAQWYPKMAEYDYEGWHANPYIGREFHSVWGSYDVKIAIDSSYVIASTGYLQNPEEIGHGYQKEGQSVKRPKGEKITYHFKADNVHDFVWAADPDYEHTTAQVPGGPTVHFFYQADTLAKNWEMLPEFTVRAFQYMNENFGKYPYDKYSVIQGGDGGMEYPMATLITGHRSLQSLVGVTVHEMIHSWFQGVLGTNESLYPWMDEGFTSYASNRTMAHLFGGNANDPRIHASSYGGYFSLAESGKEEPMTTHSDHYNTNRAYGLAAYSKGAVFLEQLSYIMGRESFQRGMKRYFNEWKFKHPNPTNLKRIMEKESGLELDWYFEYFVNTTHTIDYGVKSVEERGESTHVTLERIDKMPMPLDVLVTYKNGEKELFYIPLRIMRGEKENDLDYSRSLMQDWPWVFPTYLMVVPHALSDIERIEIDPSYRMADIDRSNNVYPDMENTRFGQETE